MAGHSKWANIKHRKGAQDKKRGKIFQKIVRQLSIAIRQGGTNVTTNNQLRLIIEKAKTVNMPKDNIDRALKKYDKTDEANYEQVIYEGYFASKIAIIVDCLTDNRKRTVSNIRSYFNKNNATLVTNSVSYLFTRVGLLVFTKPDIIETQALEWAVECEVLDFEANDGTFIFTTKVENFWKTKDFLEKNDITNFDVSELIYQANEQVSLDDTELVEQFQQLINILEDDDDIQNIYHNLCE